MDALSHIVVIYNPHSTGPSKEKGDQLVNKLRRRRITIPVEMLQTEYAGHATKLAYEQACKYKRPLIISSSGDGGYNEVINGALRAQLEGANPVCAVLPAGNANDHRRAVARRPLWKAIEQHAIEHIDVLNATIDGALGETTRYAHSYIGLGLTPAIAMELNRASLNRLKEAIIVLRSIHKVQSVEIDVHEKRLVLDSLIFANISQMAKVLTIAENARPDDGLMKVVSFPHTGSLRLLFKLIKATISGTQGISSTSYSFTAVNDMVLQFDGEITNIEAKDKVTISVESHILSTLR